MQVKTAMLLAAGRGTRLRPLTDKIPKPLARAAGRSLLCRALDTLARAGVERAVINVHHKADMLAEAVRAAQSAYAMELLISDERDRLLDSAGGIIRALPLLGSAPFFVLNADSFWDKEQGNNWRRLAAAFNPAKQDMLLFTVPQSAALVPQKGDFFADAAGRLRRAGKGKQASGALIYAGGLIANPAVFAAGEAEGACRRREITPQSLNLYFDKALARRRLYGLELKARWFSVGSPAELAAAEALLRAG